MTDFRKLFDVVWSCVLPCSAPRLTGTDTHSQWSYWSYVRPIIGRIHNALYIYIHHKNSLDPPASKGNIRSRGGMGNRASSNRASGRGGRGQGRGSIRYRCGCRSRYKPIASSRLRPRSSNTKGILTTSMSRNKGRHRKSTHSNSFHGTTRG